MINDNKNILFNSNFIEFPEINYDNYLAYTVENIRTNNYSKMEIIFILLKYFSFGVCRKIKYSIKILIAPKININLNEFNSKKFNSFQKHGSLLCSVPYKIIEVIDNKLWKF